jgi:tetratricopeptide (TPR) repeat protein
MSAPGAKPDPKKAAAEREAKERELFAQFVQSTHTLIADPNGSSRVRLGATLAELGAKQNAISYAGTYEEAQAVINERRPRLILCEFALGPHSGLDLLIDQRKLKPELKDCVFALITGNTSQSAVAAAAEEDVDTFIIKPYTLDSLKRTLTKAAVTKLYPSDYVKTIEAGKKQLFGGGPQAALKTFEQAVKMDPKPALACFYKGQAEDLLKALDTASKDFKQGLTYNKIHYKCLIGLYELMMKKKEYKEAYGVVKRVAQYFPANPKRLASVLRLAIMTESYEDIEAYYRIFTMIENRNDELVRYICSALIVTGRYYFMNKYNTRALELVEKAAVSSAGKTSFLRYAIELLVEFDKHEEAKGMLKRFPPDQQKGADYQSMDLLIARKSLDTGVLLQKGREVLKSGVESPVIYEIMIEASTKAGLGDTAEELYRVASKRYPDHAGKFKSLMGAPVAAATPA